MSNIPLIDQTFFCIVNSNSTVLVSISLSYIFNGKYPLIFEFNDVTTSDDDTDLNELDIHYISRNKGRKFNIVLRNTLKLLEDVENILLIGLTEDQKSYLNFPEDFNIIEINEINDIDFLLSPYTTNTEKVKFNDKNLLSNYNYALQNKAILEYDRFSDNNFEISVGCSKKELLFVEETGFVNSLIGINYGISAEFHVIILPKLDFNKKELQNLIFDWKQGNTNAYNQLHAIAYKNIDYKNFSEFDLAVFFTEGYPYSLILNNIIPISHVHLNLSPDFLVFNNLYYENHHKFCTSVIFSPQYFKDDEEEVNVLVKKFEEENYFQFNLIGENATASNIDYTVQTFPFNILHFCSHGGEVKGYHCKGKFIDRFGDEHEIEYYEVPSIMPGKEELIKVIIKNIFLKFDVLLWKSKELKALNYAHEVFVDMMNYVNDLEKKAQRDPIDSVPNSSAISCKYFNYQAIFDIMANFHSPMLVFNNTCWSNTNIKDSFIDCGTRNYIGTLWEINTDYAKNFSENFYSNIIDDEMTLLESFHSNINVGCEDKDLDIYIFWGLNISKFQKNTESDGRNRIQARLWHFINVYSKAIMNTTNKETKASIKSMIKYMLREYSEFLK